MNSYYPKRKIIRSESNCSVRYSKIRSSSGESSGDSDSGGQVLLTPVRTLIPPERFISRYFPGATKTYESQNLWSSVSTTTMVSRKKILSRSRDGLNSDFQEEEDDIWFQKDRLFKDEASVLKDHFGGRLDLSAHTNSAIFLYFPDNLHLFQMLRRFPLKYNKAAFFKDHIQEVLNKWKQIDDEIWAKIIVMERNRRVAKAYARAPVLTINGSDDGFDGYRIGLCGFDNPMRDAKTEEIKKHIGHGVKIKMDDGGNIMIKRVSRSNVYVKEVKTEENSISNEVILAGGLLEIEKPVKIFDMKKFAANVNRELRKAYPDRRKLESQCISAISFVKDSPELLDCSCCVMVINIVALDMLRSKLPPVSKRSSIDKMDRRQISQEEDPYSVLSSFSENTTVKMTDTIRDPKPPKLPPRDVDRVPVPVPDYDDWNRESSMHRVPQQSRYKDDPYYCGMKARVPNFGKKIAQIPDEAPPVRKSHSSGYLSLLRQNDKTLESTRGSDILTDEEYARLYGRMRAVPSHTQGMFVGEWE